MERVKAHPDLNATAASLLGFLHQGAMSGWDLAQTVSATIGDFWNVTKSQIYRELRTLEGLGLVEAGTTGTRERRPYAVTEAGRDAFAAWIAREPGDDVVRSPLLLTVFFGAAIEPRRFARFLAVHRLRHEERLERYGELESACSGVAGMEWTVHALRYGIEHESAVLRWFKGFEASSPAEQPQ